MAINYFRTVLSVALQLMAMTLIIGIGSDFLNSYYGKMSQNVMNLEELVVMLIFAIAFYVLSSKIPSMLSSIVTGGGFNSSGVSNFTGGAMAGAVATSMATMSLGMTKAVGTLDAIKSIVGGGQGGNSAIDAIKNASSASAGGEFSTPRESKGVSNYPFGEPPKRPS